MGTEMRIRTEVPPRWIARAARHSLLVVLVWIALVQGLSAQTVKGTATSGNATLQEFQKRVGDFIKLHKQVEAKLAPLKPTPVSKEIIDHQQMLANGIIQARKSAKQGDIFTGEIIAEFQRLIGVAMRGPNGANIRTSLAHSEPVNIEVGVNSKYPGTLPLQSSPPTLLLNLPKLPPELDYRIVGTALVLRDVTANLVIDFMPGAIPPAGSEAR